ncbi:MAG: thioesterase family protein [Synoicihabitans sp.]
MRSEILPMMESKSTIRVRYAETDMMGVVYHGSYTPWLEIARTDMFRQVGMTYLELEQAGYRLPVLSLEVKYLRPALYDDLVTITVRLPERPRLRITLSYELHRDEALLATATTQHAFVDKAGQPTRPPAVFVDKMKSLFAA